MALACAHNACAAVTQRGQVFAWGSNCYGELAQPECALETHDAVLQIDDDASVHRPHQPLTDFLRTFPPRRSSCPAPAGTCR